MFGLDLVTARTVLDNLALLLLASALVSMLVRRLDTIFVLLAGQGLLLTATAAVAAAATGTTHAYLAVVLTLIVKVIGIPGILLFALREVKIKREIELVLPPQISLVLAVALVLVAYHVMGPYTMPEDFRTRNSLPAALSLLLIGLLQMMTRRKALSQVAGLVAMENGVYLTALVATHGLPLAVELGVAIDLFVGALVMGIVARQIQRTFGTINTDHLRTLRG